MGFDPFVHDRLAIVRLRRPDVETSRMIARLVEHRHEHLGQPLWFALIIGRDCPMPDPESRRQLAADLLRLSPRLAVIHTVVLGRELRQALVRSLVTGFAMLPGCARSKLDGSTDQLLAAIERELGLDPRWLSTQLVDARILDRREAKPAPAEQPVT